MERRADAEEADAFWRIALSEPQDQDGGIRGSFNAHDPDSASDGEDDAVAEAIGTAGARATVFPLRSERCAPITLRLAPLPPRSGVWSPVGADAWYGAALLTGLLLQHPSDRLQACLDAVDRRDGDPFTALELGSGAVGLPGIALAWRLLNHHHDDDDDDRRHRRSPGRVLLTDTDRDCLAQLAANARGSLRLFRDAMQRGCEATPDVPDDLLTVAVLDWGDGLEILRARHDLRCLNLVLGSELVYTPEGAAACAGVVEAILTAFPEALVVIVQVADREGWRNVFLPRLRDNRDLRVQVEGVPLVIHEAAAELIPMGGALDRFDFEVCYISRKDVTI